MSHATDNTAVKVALITTAGTIVAALITAGVMNDWFSRGGASSTTPTATREPATPPVASVTPSSPVETVPSGSCQVTIADRRIPLQEQPDRFSQQIVVVPPGDYDVISTSAPDRFGDRWLQIVVGNRAGWVPDDTFAIESKTNACP